MSEVPATGDWSALAVPGYEILDELGRGGMGVVYKARQASSGRLVALKMIRDGALAGPQERARFRIEAEAAARLQHPNVVQIYEVGEHAGPAVLRHGVRRGRQPRPAPRRPAAARPRGRPSWSARWPSPSAHAHEQQIVHRDLKPANILLAGVGSGQESEEPTLATPDSRLPSPVPKITDFGLAKRLDTRQHRLDAGRGGPGHAELHGPRAGGRAGPARSARPTDVYALGAILYELLTGRPPFQADSWDETVQQVLHDEPAPPTRLRPDVPRDLETVCLKCLEKEPGRRYASAAELADDLGRFLDGQPVAAVPLGDDGAAGPAGRPGRLPASSARSAAGRGASSTTPCTGRSSSPWP